MTTKKLTCVLALALVMALTLTSCGKGSWNPFPKKSAGTSGASSSQTGPEASSEPEGDQSVAEEKTIQGTVNRSGDYLVLLTENSEYIVFDFGPEIDVKTFAEGDDVTVTYTGELGSEDPVPVAVAIVKAQ